MLSGLVLLFFAFASLALAGCAAPRASEHSTEKVTFRLPNPVPPGPQKPMEVGPLGVANFGVISFELWRGAEPTTDGLKVLAYLGVKTIIDLREADESTEIPPGVRYVRLPVSAWRADQVDVHAVLREIARSPKPVFIHCHEGRDRTGLAVAAYRLAHGMSVEDACLELRNFGVNPWWVGPIERRIRELTDAR
jgi:protein tyrosine phosphatase (PTP) superfamily phosphohydrolase (DUF442 family)